MDISNLVQIFATKLDSTFKDLGVSVVNVSTDEVMFDGIVSDLVHNVYSGRFDGKFTVCEILRCDDEEALSKPIYNRPFIITVV